LKSTSVGLPLVVSYLYSILWKDQFMSQIVRNVRMFFGIWPCIKLISSTDDFKQAAMFNEVL